MGASATQWNRSGTASAMSLGPLVSFIRASGMDADSILREVGVSPACLDDCDQRIPAAAGYRAWSLAAEKAHDPYFGLRAGEHAQVGAFDVLDYSLYFSANLGEALDRIVRFHRLLSDGLAFAVTKRPRELRLRRIERAPASEVDAAFTVIVLRARELTGEEVVPQEVRFAHAAPADRAPYAALFRCPIRFGCADSEIAFGARELALPIRTANPGVNRILDRYMKELLARLPAGESFVERVRSVVARNMVQRRPTLQSTARELHASPRTLQRRLSEHGISHAQILDSVRRDLAEALVSAGRLSITEIAFLLGFGDLSGFRRVYKRWTGVAPSRGRLASRPK